MRLALVAIAITSIVVFAVVDGVAALIKRAERRRSRT